jgi:hypothetical protein
LIRSLVRGKEYLEAEREILRSHPTQPITSQIYTALIYAYKEDLPALEKELQKQIELRMNPNSFHYDADLGPLLRNQEKLRPLLEKYPMPKELQGKLKAL